MAYRTTKHAKNDFLLGSIQDNLHCQWIILSSDGTQNTSGDLGKIALQIINAATYNKYQNTH